jgi:DNA adenine methylase
MRYLGGKARLAKRICAILEQHRSPGQRFVDVFTGGANIVAGMGDHGPRVANDGCEPLIALYKTWLEGWRPPADVSEELYREIKARQDPTDPLTAFVGFGCSFGGKWFGSYARCCVKPGTRWRVASDYPGAEPANFADTTARTLARKLSRCRDVQFTCQDFAAVEILPGDLVYCDSPYFGTEAYDYFDGFDYPKYVDKLTEWAQFADVFVSEYAAQAPNWEPVAEFPHTRKGLRAKQTNIEHLYRVRKVTEAQGSA